jgi:hypothetical protein
MGILQPVTVNECVYLASFDDKAENRRITMGFNTGLGLKISYTKDVNEEANRNLYTGNNAIHRFLSLFWAEARYTWYLFWASIARSECMFIGYGQTGKRSLIGTVTGSIFDNTLIIKRIFWCEGERK